MVNEKNKNTLIVSGMSVLGLIFLIWYINCAITDVPVINDYIREINEFVGNGKLEKYILSTKFFSVPPIKILTMWININFMSYSVKFDMILGCIGLTGCAFMCLMYCKKMEFKYTSYVVVFVYVFSLTKWEMIINGTGWVHFWAFAGFLLYYYLLDLWYIHKKQDKTIRYAIIILPIVNILGIAAFYGLVYAIISIGTYLIIIFKKREKEKINTEVVYVLSILIPILIYIICSILNNDTRLVTNGSFIENLINNPLFFITFFVASFSSEIIGVETLLAYPWGKTVAIILGIIVICAYLMCIWVNVYYKLYKNTYIPLMLLVHGFLNHGIVLASRWGFNDITYGMSSRYSLQYMVGGLGIILTFFLMKKSKITWGYKIALGICLAFVLIGNLWTTKAELAKAQYRKYFYQDTEQMLMNSDVYTDEQLAGQFNIDSDSVREAIKIMKDNDLSLWK